MSAMADATCHVVIGVGDGNVVQYFMDGALE